MSLAGGLPGLPDPVCLFLPGIWSGIGFSNLLLPLFRLIAIWVAKPNSSRIFVEIWGILKGSAVLSGQLPFDFASTLPNPIRLHREFQA